jgi:hypothetical protein
MCISLAECLRAGDDEASRQRCALDCSHLLKGFPGAARNVNPMLMVLEDHPRNCSRQGCDGRWQALLARGSAATPALLHLLRLHGLLWPVAPAPDPARPLASLPDLGAARSPEQQQLLDAAAAAYEAVCATCVAACSRTAHACNGACVFWPLALGAVPAHARE